MKKWPKPPVDSWRLGTDTVKAEAPAGFDELVVGDWFHMEQMDTRFWWMRLGDVSWNIMIGRDGIVKVTWQEGKLPMNENPARRSPR